MLALSRRLASSCVKYTAPPCAIRTYSANATVAENVVRPTANLSTTVSNLRQLLIEVRGSLCNLRSSKRWRSVIDKSLNELSQEQVPESILKIAVVGEINTGKTGVINLLLNSNTSSGVSKANFNPPLDETVLKGEYLYQKVVSGDQRKASGSGDELIVEYPSDWLLSRKVQFIEVSGISNFIENQKLLDEVVHFVQHECDVVLFVTDSRRQLTQSSERRLLKAISNGQKSNIVFLLNGVEEFHRADEDQAKFPGTSLEIATKNVKTYIKNEVQEDSVPFFPLSTQIGSKAINVGNSGMWEKSGLGELKSFLTSHLDPHGRTQYKLMTHVVNGQMSCSELSRSLDERLRLIGVCQQQLLQLDSSVRAHESSLLDNFLNDDLELLDELFMDMKANASFYMANLAYLDDRSWARSVAHSSVINEAQAGWLMSTLPLYWKIGNLDITDGLMRTLGREFLREAEYKMIYLIGKLEEGVKNHVCEVSDVFNRIGKEEKFLNYEVTYQAAREISLMKNDLRRQYHIPTLPIRDIKEESNVYLRADTTMPIRPVTSGLFPNIMRSDPFRLSNKIWEHQTAFNVYEQCLRAEKYLKRGVSQSIALQSIAVGVAAGLNLMDFPGMFVVGSFFSLSSVSFGLLKYKHMNASSKLIHNANTLQKKLKTDLKDILHDEVTGNLFRPLKESISKGNRILSDKMDWIAEHKGRLKELEDEFKRLR
eukprot:Nk52_evm32s2367 gene=Nk52_evmTU32s2367